MSEIFYFDSLKKKFLSHFNEDSTITVNAVLFSDHDDNSLTNAVSDLHLSRLINAGGLYFHALLGTLSYLLGRKLKKKWASALALGLSSFYLLAAFPRFSLIRLTFVYIFKWINEHVLKKRFSYLEILSLSAIFFLLIKVLLGGGGGRDEIASGSGRDASKVDDAIKVVKELVK